jgi:hypothetical protein
VFLAEQQMESGAWRRPDPDERSEADTAVDCLVCHAPLVPFLVMHWTGKAMLRKPTRGQKVCRACSQKGWRSKPCVVCAGPTQTWAWSSKRRAHATRGTCPACKLEMHRTDAKLRSGGYAKYAMEDA